jgi:hypothetical protein
VGGELIVTLQSATAIVHDNDPGIEIGLSHFRFRIGDRFEYAYDFTAGWVHGIRIEAIESTDTRALAPVCTGGHGFCPFSVFLLLLKCCFLPLGMPKLKQRSGMSKLRSEDVLRLLQDARPEQVEAVELPDGSMEIHFIPEQPAKVSGKKGTWAKVAEEFSKKAPLLGMSEEFLDLTRRFRQNFGLKSPFDTKG